MKVSVIMPVYNGAQYLQEAIDSILNQTFKDFELIIIDDGSSDESAEIIQKNADKDKRIVALKNEQNSGICVTLNKGLDIAKGEYIARMDSDDISEPNRLVVQIDFLERNPEYGLVGSNTKIFGDNISVPYVFEFDKDWRMCIADMIYASCMAHPTVMMRASILQEKHLRYKDEFRGLEDFYMWWQFAKFSKISNIQQPLLNYRYHKKQETQKAHDEKHIAKGVRFLNERLEYLNICLTEYQKTLMLKYIYGGSVYNDSELDDFIHLSKRILTDVKKTRPELVDATRLVMAKAISLALNTSYRVNKINKSKAYYTRKAYINGCMSIMWFIKSRIYQILGK